MVKFELADFGPKNAEEEKIFAEEAARVDREVADYKAALAGDRIAKVKVFYRSARERVEE